MKKLIGIVFFAGIGIWSYFSSFTHGVAGCNRGYYSNGSTLYTSLKWNYTRPVLPTLYYTPALQTGVDEYGLCRKINNPLGLALFIPTRTENERFSFLYNKPSGVTLSGCNITQLPIKCIKVYYNGDPDNHPRGYYLMNPRIATSSKPCTDPKTLGNLGIAWRDTGAQWIGPKSDCTYITDYYIYYNTFTVDQDNSLVEIAASADDQQRTWIWKNMDKNQEILTTTGYVGTYDTTGPFRCGAKYWSGRLDKGDHTIVFMVDDTYQYNTLGIASVKVNGVIKLSSKNDNTRCGNSVTNESYRKTTSCATQFSKTSCLKCGPANNQTYSSLSSTNIDLCNGGYATNFVAGSYGWSRKCGTYSCSAMDANAPATCGFDDYTCDVGTPSNRVTHNYTCPVGSFNSQSKTSTWDCTNGSTTDSCFYYITTCDGAAQQ